MRIGYLGAGTWGVALANLLASNGHQVILWAARPEFVKFLKEKRQHPKLPKCTIDQKVEFTSDIKEALFDVDFVIESVTSVGLRPVLEKVVQEGGIKCPFVITSKGIEQDSGLLLTEVAIDVLGNEFQDKIGILSGPSLADEVVRNLPTSVVCASFDKALMFHIRDLFSSLYFRVYPNSDVNGVAFGGSVKNIMAIACGISDGLGFGDNTKAALMTRGLHEIKKLSVTKGCQPETLNGLAGMGDLCATCLSKLSRNHNFGRFLAEGYTPEQAQEKIGMVVEGVYTSVSVRQISKKYKIPVPITEGVYSIIYEKLNPRDAVKALLERAIKEEHL